MSKIVRSIKNVANGYSSTQILVRKATSNDPSGPTTYDMEEISASSYNSQTEFLEIMDMLDRRLNDKGKNWRHVAKSLTVLDYLVRFGSEKCVLWAKDNLYIIKTLREFVHFDEANNDQGALIRVKAKELVALLRDDERLARERLNAKSSTNNSRNRRRQERLSEPYDADLQRALELSRETAEQESRRPVNQDEDDPELQAALKLSLEEEEMRKRERQNENLLDLDDTPQQYQPQYAYVQPVQYFQPQQTFYAQPQQQYDMFGNPIQPTGYYQQGQYGQFQQPQYTQPQIPQYTGFNNGLNSPDRLEPLKTGSNNPFALQDSRPQQLQPQQQSLNNLAQQQQQNQQQQQPAFFTQPQAPTSPARQQTQSSRFNDSHELNALLATGTGIDTFGNTGATRIPHQHTKTGTFINSQGTGYRQETNNVRLSSNATGNPFLNTGIGNTATSGNLAGHGRMEPAATGYGFGNSKDEPSLIDI
ncbi:CIC11C00000005348 [Sungouiella intermedia]|uniref:CIC11C00000005348 n=1 Tax=Sungouiella intermedia TaxID=45354 RepID=A0A1L0DDK3_9ASCO|nr:CIC11C00000005348 [[Candida] intermedia]